MKFHICAAIGKGKKKSKVLSPHKMLSRKMKNLKVILQILKLLDENTEETLRC
jgi:hypothetical protein